MGENLPLSLTSFRRQIYSLECSIFFWYILPDRYYLMVFAVCQLDFLGSLFGWRSDCCRVIDNNSLWFDHTAEDEVVPWCFWLVFIVVVLRSRCCPSSRGSMTFFSSRYHSGLVVIGRDALSAWIDSPPRPPPLPRPIMVLVFDSILYPFTRFVVSVRSRCG